MENQSILHLKPEGSTTDKAIINALNQVITVLYDRGLIKCRDEVTQNIKDIAENKKDTLELKQTSAADNEAILDLDFRLSKIEEG